MKKRQIDNNARKKKEIDNTAKKRKKQILMEKNKEVDSDSKRGNR